MTVAELMAQLSVLPPDMPVVVQMGKTELGNGREVEAVDVVLAQTDSSGQWLDLDWFWGCQFDADDGYLPPRRVCNLTSQLRTD